jgi:hypothetical protein
MMIEQVLLAHLLIIAPPVRAVITHSPALQAVTPDNQLLELSLYQLH